MVPEAFASYWQPYVDAVWQRYTQEPLIIDTQLPMGYVRCRVTGDLLHCDGDNRPYAKPTAADIWGCDSGPFRREGGDNDIHVAVIPRLCAAFARSTLMLDGGSLQPSVDDSWYYGELPTHHYSRLVHEYEVDGKGYAFPYDDVNPNGGGNAAGVVASGAAERLTIFVGGMSS
jgi:hypothetical protein